MAPGSDDLSTKAYAYTSSVDAASHPNAGLIGLLLVATPGTLRPAVPGAQQALPEGVDHLVTLLFNVQNENESPYLEWNAAEAGVDQDGVDPDAFEESNLMHCINGAYTHPTPPQTPREGCRRGDCVQGLLQGQGNGRRVQTLYTEDQLHVLPGKPSPACEVPEQGHAQPKFNTAIHLLQCSRLHVGCTVGMMPGQEVMGGPLLVPQVSCTATCRTLWPPPMAPPAWSCWGWGQRWTCTVPCSGVR